MADVKKIALKLLVDKVKNKVVLVESNEYFVQVLFSFLSFPIGAISQYYSKNAMVGCIDLLYKSVESLGHEYFQSKSCLDKLLKPTWGCSTPIHCYMNLNKALKCNICKKVLEEIVPWDTTGNYLISDSISVKKVSIGTGLHTLYSFGVKDFSAVEEKIINVGQSEVFDLLKSSFLCQSPFSDVLLKTENRNGKEKMIKTEPLNKDSHPFDQTVRDSFQNISLKLLIRKSENKVLYAVANDVFVNLLVSVLPSSMETLLELFSGHSSIGCMDNLYSSEGNLCDQVPEKFKRQDKKTFDPTRNGGFVKGPALFKVTDDLAVEPFSTISSISFINKLGIPLYDLEERSAHVGEQEALSIIKALLTTRQALTTVFCQKNY